MKPFLISLRCRDIRASLFRSAVVPLAFAVLAAPASADYFVNLSADPPMGASVSQVPNNPHPVSPPETTRLRVFYSPALPGIDFLGWMENGTIVSTDPRYEFMVTRDRNLVAANRRLEVHTGIAWTDGVIPYVFDPAVTAGHQQKIAEAMDHWAYDTGTRLAFVPWEGDVISPGRSILKIRYNPDLGSQYSSASVTGMPNNGSENTLEMAINSLNSDPPKSIDHELGHVLGLHHTHQRRERGNHIDIDWPNLITPTAPATLTQYAIIADSDWIPGTNTEPYDILSIMHYINGAGITARASEPNANIFNQYDYVPSIQLSDINHVRNVYGVNAESRFVDPAAGAGGANVGSLKDPHVTILFGVISNAQRNDPGSRLWVKPGNYDLVVSRITGPQKILPYPGGGPVRIYR